MRVEPATLRSPVKHSTTEPLRSHIDGCCCSGGSSKYMIVSLQASIEVNEQYLVANTVLLDAFQTSFSTKGWEIHGTTHADGNCAFCAVSNQLDLVGLTQTIHIEQRKKAVEYMRNMSGMIFFSSPEQKAPGELIGWESSRRPSIRGSTLSNMDISETSWRIIIKFHLEHHCDGGLAALGFGPDRLRTLVSMETDSSHRVIMGKSCDHSRAFIFDWFFFLLAGNENNHNISDGFEIQQDLIRDL